MNKKLIGILAASVLVINSFNVFANEIDTIDKAQDIVTQEVDLTQDGQDTAKESIEVLESIGVLSDTKKEMILQLDSTIAIIDGLEHTLTANPKVVDGSTYLPLRFMADKLLEAKVDWDGVNKEVTISKDEKRVQVKVGSREAFINGDKVGLTNSPIIDKGTTYLPLRTMAELFEIQTDYNQSTRQITLTKINESSNIPVGLNKAPIADFDFLQDEYTEGQIVRAIDKSYDEDGDMITSSLWMINFNEKQANSKLENIFSKPKAGTYLVSLKVKDAKGIWSEWATKEIVINPNLKPVVTKLTTNKESYAGGEGIFFTYAYENEPWENIKAERWTYREIGEPTTKAVVDKPKFIFHEGEYVVTLQLQDDNNNWSDAKEVIVNITKESGQSELEYRFTQGNIGDIIDNFADFNYQNYKLIAPDISIQSGGTLLMSDSPEDVKYKGILYRDTVEGVGRILLHHHNSFTEEENSAERKRLVLVAENPTDEPVNFVISNKVVKGPASDTLYVGQQLLYDFLKGGGEEKYSLNPGEKIYIYDSGNRKWEKGHLISGKMDFNVSGQITLTVAAIGEKATIDEIALLPELGKDVHPRGTFNKTDIYYKIDLKDDEPTKLLLGTGTEEWLNGYDAITGEMVQNRGNYGVTYTIEITANEDTGIILNPRAGVFRGAIKWDGKNTYLAPSKGYFSGHNSKAVMLGVIKAGETRKLEYVLPNGSASPVLLGFIPKDHWDQ